MEQFILNCIGCMGKYNFDFFLNNEEAFIECWKNKNYDFWFKVVITLRNTAIQKIQFNPFIGDGYFIELMKHLRLKSFTATSEFIKNMILLEDCNRYLPNLETFIKSLETQKQAAVRNAVRSVMGEIHVIRNKPVYELQFCYDLNMLCAGTVLMIMEELIKNPAISETLTWQVPSLWFYPSGHKLPFDKFLQDRHATTITSLLTGFAMTKDNIGWWTSKVKLQKINPTIKLGPQHFFSPNLGWLPKKYNRPTSGANNAEDLMQKHKAMYMNLLTLSFPPLMSWRYHSAKASAVNVNCHHCMSIGPWFVLWQETYGPGYLDLINHMTKKVMALARFEYDLQKSKGELKSAVDDGPFKNNIGEWGKQLQQMTDLVGVLRDLPASPRQPGDSVESSAEFLLEPCVLVQLPWSFILLRQWLIAAFIEVIKFELQTVEFRHWPIPREAEECVRELLFLIKQTKSSLLLGFYFCCRITNSYPNTIEEMPANIMDKVVLPSMPTLELLCSGEAYRILHTLKQVCFATSRSLKSDDYRKLKWLMPDVYLPLEELQVSFTQNYLHLAYWSTIVFEEVMNSSILSDSIIENLSEEVPPPPKSRQKYVTDFSKEEQCAYDRFYEDDFKNKEAKDNQSEVMKKFLSSTALTLETVVVNGYLPHSSLKALKEMFLSKKAEVEAHALSKGNKTNSFIQKVFMSSFMHNMIRKKLHGCEMADSVEYWCLRITGEIIEREQLARVALAGALLCTRQSPTLPGLIEEPATNLAPLLEKLRSTHALRNTRQRDWLWNLLPPSWNEPVPREKPAVPTWSKELNFAENVKLTVAALEARIGHILGSVAKDSFEVWGSGGVGFPEWSILQYVIPGHLAALLDVARDHNVTEATELRAHNLTTMLHNIIAMYEHKYHQWLKVEEYRLEAQAKLDYEEQTVTQSLVTADHYALLHRESQLKCLTYACVGLGDGSEGYTGENARNLGFIQFHLRFTNIEDWNLSSSHEKFVFDAVKKVSHVYFKNMYEVCLDVWHPPAPGETLKDTQLEEIYLANAVLSRIVVAMLDVLFIDLKDSDMPEREKKEFIQSCTSNSWHCELMSRVMQVVGRVPHIELKSEINAHFMKRSQEVLNNMWVKLCRTVRRIGVFPTIVEQRPTDSPIMTKAINLFLAECLDELGVLIKLKPSGGGRSIQTLKGGIKKLQSKSSEEQNATRLLPQDGIHCKSKHSLPDKTKSAVRRCPGCRKKETMSRPFSVCTECEDENYPKPQYYCSKTCKDHVWKDGHMAEHLEFSLGLCNLSNKN